MSILSFGAGVQLKIPDALTAGCFGEPAEPVLPDVTAAVTDALRNPVDFPPLAKMTIPEDRVAIVLEDGIPCVQQIVLGIVQELLAVGIEPGRICIVRGVGDARNAEALPTGLLPGAVRDRVEIVQHQTDCREALCFLGAAKNGLPVYVNRRIADADVVLPVGILKPAATLAYFGVNGGIVQFADESTQQRFFSPRSAFNSSEKRKRSEEVREISWALGTRMTVQVLPGPDGHVLRVLAGDANSLQCQGVVLANRLWTFSASHRASLVVATITGEKPGQTWLNFARALNSCLNVVAPDGTIAICSSISLRPGPPFRRLAGENHDDSAHWSVHKDKSPDAIPAAQLLRALELNRVYLLSDLDEEVVEDLGIAYVSDAQEIVRLMRGHESCFVLRNAQQSVINVTEE